MRRLIDRKVDGLDKPAYEVSVGTAAYRMVYQGLGFTFGDPVSLDPELAKGIALIPWDQELCGRLESSEGFFGTNMQTFTD